MEVRRCTFQTLFEIEQSSQSKSLQNHHFNTFRLYHFLVHTFWVHNLLHKLCPIFSNLFNDFLGTLIVCWICFYWYTLNDIKLHTCHCHELSHLCEYKFRHTFAKSFQSIMILKLLCIFLFRALLFQIYCKHFRSLYRTLISYLMTCCS